MELAEYVKLTNCFALTGFRCTHQEVNVAEALRVEWCPTEEECDHHDG